MKFAEFRFSSHHPMLFLIILFARIHFRYVAKKVHRLLQIFQNLERYGDNLLLVDIKK